MSIVVLCCATGSPGVTTTALGMALTWPRDVVLADCNRSPDQALLAGWLCGVSAQGRGLMALASMHREGIEVRSGLADQTFALLPGPPSRRFLPGFSHPAASQVFDVVWPDLAAAFDDLGRWEVDVIVDAGHIGPRGLPEAIVTAAESIIVVTRTSLQSLASLRLYLPILHEQAEDLGARSEIALALVGEGMPYTAGEIGRQFSSQIAMSLPFDVKGASSLHDPDRDVAKFHKSGLGHSLTRASRAMAGHIEQRRRVIARDFRESA